MTDIPPPQSATLGLHPVARRLLLINRPWRDGTLSSRWYTAATGGSRTRDLAIAKSSLVPLGHRVPYGLGMKSVHRRTTIQLAERSCTLDTGLSNNAEVLSSSVLVDQG